MLVKVSSPFSGSAGPRVGQAPCSCGTAKANSQSLITLVLAASASALAIPAPLARETCAYQCSDVCYFQRTIDAAVAKGYNLYNAGSAVGESLRTPRPTRS